ncbi:MAG: DUF6599 family protein, partial [Phycisphaerae bacterium]
VSTAEVVVGAIILLLVAGIVAGLVITAATQRGELFTIPPKHQAGQGLPRELAVARQLLPSTSADGTWRLDEDSLRLPAPDDDPPIYSARYVSSGPDHPSVVVKIYDLDSPERARRFFQARRPAGAPAARDVLAAVTAQASLGMADFVGPTSVGFWSGRYYTELDYTNLPRADRAEIMSLAATLSSRQLRFGPGRVALAGERPTTLPAAATTEVPAGHALLPVVGQPRWRPPAQIRVFGPANLYEKIDGRAALYHSFGFVRLTFATYRHASRPQLYVDCYLYDMGQPENAFGIFKAEQPDQAEPAEVGRQGYRAASSIFFWKGSYYVQLLTAGTERAYERFVPALAEAIAARIDDDGSKLWADAILPDRDRVPGSFTFQKSDAFNLEFLTRLYMAEYSAGGQTWTTFVHRAASPAAAQALLGQYADYLERYGKLLDRQRRSDGQMVAGQVGGYYDVVFCKGRYFGGINGATAEALARRRALAFMSYLRSQD